MMTTARVFNGAAKAARVAGNWCLIRAAECAAKAHRWPLLIAVAAMPVLAAPPPVGSEDWEILAPHAEWVQGLQHNGLLCCSIGDGRPVEARLRAGRWQVRWRKDQLEGAPTDWTDVPEAVVMQTTNPIGMPIAFFWGKQIRCFIPPGGV